MMEKKQYQVSKKLKTELPYDLVIAPEYISERNKNTNMHPVRRRLHSAALFTITKIWKQPECQINS